jgi:hypothetical protein
VYSRKRKKEFNWQLPSQITWITLAIIASCQVKYKTHRISCGEVDAQTTSPSTQQEHKDIFSANGNKRIIC